MSTNFDLYGKAFDFDSLKKEGPKIGLNPIKCKDNNENDQIYQHDDNYVWAFRCPDNSVSFTVYGSNYQAVDGLENLANAIGAELVSEHDDLDEIAIRWGRKSGSTEADAIEIDDIEDELTKLGEEDEFDEDEDEVWYDEILTKTP